MSGGDQERAGRARAALLERLRRRRVREEEERRRYWTHIWSPGYYREDRSGKALSPVPTGWRSGLIRSDVRRAWRQYGAAPEPRRGSW